MRRLGLRPCRLPSARPFFLLTFDRCSAFLTRTASPAVGEQLMPHARCSSAMRTNHHDVGHVNRRLFLENAALNSAPRIRLQMSFDDVDALDENSALAGMYLDDAAGLSAILAGNYHYPIISSYVDLYVHISISLGCKAHDLHESLVSKLACDRTEYARSHRFIVGLDQDRGVLIKPYICSVASPGFFSSPYNHGPNDLPLFNRAVRRRLFDRCGNHVPEPGAGARVSAKRKNHRDALGAGVISDLEYRSHL